MIKPRKAPKLFFVIGALVVIALVVTVLEVTNTTHLFHKAPPAVTASQDTKGEVTGGSTASQASQSSSSSQSNQPGDSKSDSGGGSTATLLVPTGQFVSNHHPNLSGSPAPNTISSVCTTTPGASCTISFTKDGVTKSLSAQTADRGGSAYWNWKLQDLGLDAGNWSVKATATLNGQTKSADDAMALTVAP